MNYTQEELSEILDISTRSLQRIENKENNPSLKTFRKLDNPTKCSSIARPFQSVKVIHIPKINGIHHLQVSLLYNAPAVFQSTSVFHTLLMLFPKKGIPNDRYILY